MTASIARESLASIPSPVRNSSSTPARAYWSVVAVALMYIVLHALVITASGFMPFRYGLARTVVNALLWFVVTPVVMAAAMRAGGRSPWRQLLIAGITAFTLAASLGLVQLRLSRMLNHMSTLPLMTGVFYFLDINLAAVGLVSALMYLRQQQLARVRRERSLLTLDARLSDARCRFLAFQLQPHFLFNALNLVAALTEESAQAAAQMLRNLRTLLDATARQSSQPWVSLRDELAVLEAYLAIVTARHAEVLAVTLNVSQAALDACIPPLALQPLLENAVRHALAASDVACFVRLDAGVRDGRLHIVITNSLLDSAAPRSGFGIGMRNTRERLARLYQETFTLALDTASECATLSLELPFRTIGSLRANDTETTDAGDARAPATVGAAMAHAFSGLRPGVTAAYLGIGIVGFWLTAWLFWSYQMYYFRHTLGDYTISAIDGGTADFYSALVWIGLTPVVLALGRMLPVQGSAWPIRALAHAGFAVGFSVLHLWILIRFGAVMETSVLAMSLLNQLLLNCLVYALLVTTMHLRAAFEWLRERQTAERRLEAELAQAQWDALSAEAQPALIAAALETVASEMEMDPVRAEESVLTLADALRLLLRSTDQSDVDINGALDALRAVLTLRAVAYGTSPLLVPPRAGAPGLRVSPTQLIAVSRDVISSSLAREVVLDVVRDPDGGLSLVGAARPGGGSFALRVNAADASNVIALADVSSTSHSREIVRA
ncbi:MAG: histidine kinase [bacterium]